MRSCIVCSLCRRHSRGADERRSLLNNRSHAARGRASNAGGVVPRRVTRLSHSRPCMVQRSSLANNYSIKLRTGRDILRAAVYDYWLEKRRRQGKPLLRRLQAQTPANDNNPYNVFRFVAWRARARWHGGKLSLQTSGNHPIPCPPSHCCRPREKVHRPQTRRRRENTEDSLDKLRMIRENVLKALEIFEMLVRRERKKRDLLVRERKSSCLL